MFGYILPCKGQLGEDGYKQFNAYYCGLCKAIGRQCSQAARLGLSYDATFLAMVLSSVCDGECEEKTERCIVHPFKKRPCIRHSGALDYGACVGVMLSYLKLLDDWHDDRSIKALLGMAVMYTGARRARKKYPAEYAHIKSCLDELSAAEAENCPDTDRTADCFARILQRLFVPDMVTDGGTRRILDWMGYNIGRWIFVIDAANDLERDYAQGSYNPLLAGFDGGDITEYRRVRLKELETPLTYTLQNAAAAFDLLEPRRNKDVLYKIIYDSLRLKQQAVLNKKTGDRDGSI